MGFSNLEKYTSGQCDDEKKITRIVVSICLTFHIAVEFGGGKKNLSF
jgi:hypothetical protein